MELRKRQAEFAAKLGLLLVYASTLPDQRVRVSWAYRDTASNQRVGGHPRSLHVSRLAIDLVLDEWNDEEQEWVWQRTTEPYELLGRFWESIGGSWGGRFGDGGHFSLTYGGMK